jgi:CRP-like cAMP-binding protein
MENAANPLAPLVRKLLLLSHLDRDDQAALLTLPHIVRQLENGHYVVREGDLPTHCCLVVTGCAIRHKIVTSGARQIVNIHVPGDMVDLQNSLLRIADHNVQAITRSIAAFIPREALVDVAFSRPAIGKALWLETLVEASIAREWIANVGRRDARTRVAHLLCEFACRLHAIGEGDERHYELPMTQEQIADTVGLTAVHVNRTLMALDAEGLTKRTRRSVVITDWQRMAEVADFNSTYLHLPQEPL